MNNLTITIAQTPAEAPNYKRDHPEIKGAIFDRAVVVKKGMESGKPSVDLIFVDDNGQEYVGMLTGDILKGLATVVENNQS